METCISLLPRLVEPAAGLCHGLPGSKLEHQWKHLPDGRLFCALSRAVLLSNHALYKSESLAVWLLIMALVKRILRLLITGVCVGKSFLSV